MRKKNDECNAYILDSYSSGSQTYHPGAILYSGRRRKETMQWKTQRFATLQKANEFARAYCTKLGLQEVENEGGLVKKGTR